MKDLSYIILGQICVAKDFRGQGVFRKLYDVFNQYASEKFDYIITEIDATNERSIAAHLTYGFEQIHQYLSKDGRKWAVVLYKL